MSVCRNALAMVYVFPFTSRWKRGGNRGALKCYRLLIRRAFRAAASPARLRARRG